MGQAVRRLCALADMADGSARGFGPAYGGFTGLFAVRTGETVVVYVNACPHVGAALDPQPDRFLSADRSVIVCGTHGAEFRIADGVCLRGPCVGAALESVPTRIEDGVILVSEDAGL